MFKKIAPFIAIIWGGLIIGNYFFAPPLAAANESYQKGQMAAMVFGALMIAVGLYTLFKKKK